MTQRSHAFAGTVRDNLALTRADTDLDELRAAAHFALLDDEMDALPLGYDTILAGGGASLSGGQRQRLCLARASSGDLGCCWTRRPAPWTPSRSTAFTPTSPSPASSPPSSSRTACPRIRDADRILVLRAGHLVEDGTQADLRAAGGEYARLLERQ